MKRFCLLVLALLLAVVALGCSSDDVGVVSVGENASVVAKGVSQEEYDAVIAERDALKKELEAIKEGQYEPEPEPPLAPQGAFDEEQIISQLEIKEYSYVNNIKTPWTFLAITNNSEFNLNITITANEKDANGTLIGISEDSQVAFEKGATMLFAFVHDEKPASIDYDINAKEEDWYECIISDLSYETTPAKEKIIVSVTNNGDTAADFVKGYALFFNGGKLVGYDTIYFTDNDNEIKSGKTINKEMNNYADFDSVQIFFSGRR